MRQKLCIYVSALVIAAISLTSVGQDKTKPLSKEAARWEHRITGRIMSIKGPQLALETRDKRSVRVDAGEAIKAKRINPYRQGTLITVYGAYNREGTLQAQSIQRAKSLPSAWPPDR